jgi:hypothetical protein
MHDIRFILLCLFTFVHFGIAAYMLLLHLVNSLEVKINLSVASLCLVCLLSIKDPECTYPHDLLLPFPCYRLIYTLPHVLMAGTVLCEQPSR